MSSLRNLVHRTSGYPVRYEATPPSTPDQPSVEPSKAWGAAAISLVDASPSSLSQRSCFRAYVFDTYPNRNLDFRCPAVFWLILKTAFPGFFNFIASTLHHPCALNPRLPWGTEGFQIYHILISVRGWTAGFDIYHATPVVPAHPLLLL